MWKLVGFLFVLTAITSAQIQTGNILLPNNTSWYLCASDDVNGIRFLVTTSDKNLTSTPNFGHFANGSGIPDEPCLTGVLVYASTWSMLNMTLQGNESSATYTHEASCHDQCVQSCGREESVPATWCLRVSNPTIHPTSVNISLAFDVPTMNTTNDPSMNPANGGVKQDGDIILSLGIGWIMWICFELFFRIDIE
ncbi:2882_t:CDS:2 [Paraglomus occultum]|uniref:2882_t:CDS:1 n=1 Tax=Paraglomus occultum TaxID=144539 RepID=A0A9N9FZH9_9GLOM|nr:2882_t:CDS:2 [Paraglomus occultum]